MNQSENEVIFEDDALWRKPILHAIAVSLSLEGLPDRNSHLVHVYLVVDGEGLQQVKVLLSLEINLEESDEENILGLLQLIVVEVVEDFPHQSIDFVLVFLQEERYLLLLHFHYEEAEFGRVRWKEVQDVWNGLSLDVVESLALRHPQVLLPLDAHLKGVLQLELVIDTQQAQFEVLIILTLSLLYFLVPVQQFEVLTELLDTREVESAHPFELPLVEALLLYVLGIEVLPLLQVEEFLDFFVFFIELEEGIELGSAQVDVLALFFALGKNAISVGHHHQEIQLEVEVVATEVEVLQVDLEGSHLLFVFELRVE